ncbi:MAG: glycosyltransferase family 2 protein [Cyanobacteria bacterium P01_A01_bin.45]
MNENLNDITFIIVSYNSERTLRGAIASCLMSLKDSYQGRGKVVVYDNASTDSSPKILDEYNQEYPNLFIGIKGKENLGFAKGNNKAVEASPSKNYVLINPDVTFKSVVITKLQETLESAKDIAVVCPKLLFLDNSVQPSIRRFPTFLYLFFKLFLGEKLQNRLYPFDYYYAQLPEAVTTIEVNWAIGAFMMVSGEYVRLYGLFDERFFLYFEDVSLCLEAWQNNYRVLFDPSVSAMHLYPRKSTSSGFNRLTLIHMISALKFFGKHRKYPQKTNTEPVRYQQNSKVTLVGQSICAESRKELKK